MRPRFWALLLILASKHISHSALTHHPPRVLAAYWERLTADGITKERLLSFERAIRSEPRIEPGQVQGLTKDLTEYLRTLKAVHSGADLASAADAVLGYKQGSSQGVSIDNPPVGEVAKPRLRELLAAAQAGAAAAAAGSKRGDGSGVEALLNALEAMLEARRELRPWTKPGGAGVANGRERDVIYLDLSLEAAVRTAVETSLSAISARPATDVLRATGLALESLALSAGSNAELVLCLKEWRAVTAAAAAAGSSGDSSWALRAKAVADRLRMSLATTGERYSAALAKPSAELGGRLRVDKAVLAIFSEEVVRSGAAAPLSQLLRVLEPRLREVAHLGAWQVISPHVAAGTVVFVPRLADVQNTVYAHPTVIVAGHVSGEEDIAAGAVAVLTPDAPDVLSHVSVRARNEKVLFATVFDADVFTALKAMEGAFVQCVPSPDGSDVAVKRADAGAAAAAGGAAAAASAAPAGAKASIVPRPFQGVYALPSAAFAAEVVGGKSRNLNGLRSAPLPAGVKLPASAALTFGAFDAALADDINAPLRVQITQLLAELASAPADEPVREGTLATLRAAVCRLVAPPALLASLRDAMQLEGIPFPGERGAPGSWDEAWLSITGVWASKWNVRAATACRKAALRHEDLSMAVLVQAVVQPRYAFVLHTVNPVSGDESEIYGELVCGLGETLVGAFPGRALSFTAPKLPGGAAGPATLRGYPSKPTGLFLRSPTLIFRSDSNGEDLEGFAGAGLYDSITMHEPTEEPIDYAGEALLSDAAFQAQLLQRIAAAGAAAELALGGVAQDVEGVVTEAGDIYIVQTRPQV
jgi:alpha-glucan,water dikinase